MSEVHAYLSFSTFPGIGPFRFQALIAQFGSARNAWGASREDLQHVLSSSRLVEKFLQHRTQFDVQAYIQTLRTLGIGFLTLTHPKYPRYLKELSDPPYVLYVRGKHARVSHDVDRCVAVVGTRKMTSYGEHVTEQIVRGLVQSGVTIVSGLAYGVDATAHRSALDAGGYTLAVLGCGADIIAPASNRTLYERIISEGQGAILSEMPLGMRPSKGLFVARNRIVSGLCLGIVVIEGTDTSGTLITADYALRQGREVFAVPGQVTSATSRASTILLKHGAHLVETSQDILDVLGIASTSASPLDLDSYDPPVRQLLSLIIEEPRSADTLARLVGKEVSMCLEMLTHLEIEGVLSKDSHHLYHCVL